MTKQPKTLKLSVAPMMAYTHHYYRYLARLLAPDIWLYTEMVVSHSLLLGERKKLLYFHPKGLPLALQLGGNEPDKLAECARIAEDYGFSEINLNVGCPSNKVQQGAFGACLLKQPELVAEAISAMKAACQLPVTVKTRIGVDELDSAEYFFNACKLFAQAGSDEIIVHARKAWLKGLSPRQNRNIPPLNYQRVYDLKQQMSGTPVSINGGFTSANQILSQADYVDGVMIGRAAIENPLLLRQLAQNLHPDKTFPKLSQVVSDYAEFMQASGNQRKNLQLQPLYHLRKGQKGASQWRQFLSQQAQTTKVDWNKISQTYRCLLQEEESILLEKCRVNHYSQQRE